MPDAGRLVVNSVMKRSTVSGLRMPTLMFYNPWAPIARTDSPGTSEAPLSEARAPGVCVWSRWELVCSVAGVGMVGEGSLKEHICWQILSFHYFLSKEVLSVLYAEQLITMRMPLSRRKSIFL